MMYCNQRRSVGMDVGWRHGKGKSTNDRKDLDNKLAEGMGPPAVFAKPLTSLRCSASSDSRFVPPFWIFVYRATSRFGGVVAAVLGRDGAGAPSGAGYQSGRSPGRSIRRWSVRADALDDSPSTCFCTIPDCFWILQYSLRRYS